MALTVNTNMKNDADGYLTDAKFIKGTYVVVDTVAERDSIYSSTAIPGTLCHVTENNKTYRKTTDGWTEENNYDDAAKAKVDAIPVDPKYTDTVYDDTALKASIAATGHTLEIAVDPATYVMTIDLVDGNSNKISTKTVDLPLETMVVSASYDSDKKEIVLTLQSGSTTSFSVADLVSGLVSTATMKAELEKKQDTISDLETIRSGAALGATALQSLPEGNVVDIQYVHTDNNYDDSAKSKVDAIPADPKYTDTIYNDTMLKQDIANKLAAPTEGLDFGKYLRVIGIDENGHPILEYVDAPQEVDVQINGASIVTDGVANIPYASDTAAGVILVKGRSGSGMEIGTDGVLKAYSADNATISSRNSSRMQLSPSNLDYAVKAAMCDGIGAAWTEEEQTAARTRMGAVSATDVSTAITEALTAIGVAEEGSY